ncbi:MAG TPA: MsnO8 family LLM class oxidoreductase [Acidimicrobiales bacterium]|nr:MsnO8 family LLM class oxidoreductase [Acidimicrobiales bacterium]
MRLSILDQSPVPSGSTPAEALRETVALAQAAERLGYTRYWLAEHHGTPGLAGTAPEVLAARVAAATATIRVGAGGVLLSHYSPIKVAETFAVLGALFPGRIDLGLGRADGASQATAAALQAGAEGAHRPFGEKLVELLDRLEAADLALPAGDRPQPWLLASSSDGAGAAAALGLPLCFAHFISTGFGPQIVARYRAAFQPRGQRQWSEASVAVAVICAATDEQAERLATSVDIWRLSSEDGRGPVPTVEEAAARPCTALERATIAQRRKGLIVGGPERVTHALERLACDFDVEELAVLTICHDPAARLRSYELLAEAFELKPPAPSDPT